MNNITLTAQLIGDPQIRRTGGENDERVAEARIQFPGIGRDSLPSQVKLTAWNATADLLIKAANGSTVLIAGRLSPYTVENNGTNERYMEVVANQVDLITIDAEESEPLDEEVAEAPAEEAAPKSVAAPAKAKPGAQNTTARRGKRPA